MRVIEPSDVSQKEPHELCLDIVVRWAETLGQLGTAKVIGSSLILCVENHRGKKVILTVPLSSEPARIGSDPRWNLVRLGSTVWKLTPSILDERIHGYVTLIDVPDPAPWL